MKMTMKNELTLKHGVILAAAVLLIAGIAFAGAAAAEATHITWSSENITAETNGTYIVDVPGNVISPVGPDSGLLTFEDNLTLDFNYATLTGGLVTGTYRGFLFRDVSAGKNHVLTIKNLVIDGGNIATSGNLAASLIGQLDKNWGACIIENVTVKNVSIEGSLYIGGFVGGTNTHCLKMVNCTLEMCDILGKNPTGGIVGCVGSPSAVVLEDCHVVNSYIESTSSDTYSGASGIIGMHTKSSSVVIRDCSVVNSIVYGNYYKQNAALFIGEERSEGTAKLASSEEFDFSASLIGALTVPSSLIVGCEAHNCVVCSQGYNAGGVLAVSSGFSANALTAIDNQISSITIVNRRSNGYAGGFAGTLNPAIVVSISNNTITNCCVVATDGDAAGFCPVVM